MPAPISDDKRQHIIDLCEAGHTCTHIAQTVQVSPTTVSNVARSIGHRFGHTNAARAREARSAFTAERRAVAAARAQERLEEVLARMGEPQEETMLGADGPETVMRQANARDWRDWASAVNTLQRTVLDVDRHDNRADEGLAAVDQWLRDITGGNG